MNTKFKTIKKVINNLIKKFRNKIERKDFSGEYIDVLCISDSINKVFTSDIAFLVLYKALNNTDIILTDNTSVYCRNINIYNKLNKDNISKFTLININESSVMFYIKDFHNISIFNNNIYYNNIEIDLRYYFSEETIMEVIKKINYEKLANKLKEF